MDINVGSFFELFDMKILRRGYSYYLEGRIITCSAVEDNKYNFLIEGTQNYKVEITLDLEGVCCMTCTCPFAQDNNCKHMATALYGLKNGIDMKELGLSVSNNELKLSDFDKFKNSITGKIRVFPYITYEDKDYVYEIIHVGVNMINTFIKSQDYSLALKSTLYLYEIVLDEDITGDFYINDDLLPMLNSLLCKFITVVNIEDILLKLYALDSGYYFDEIVKSICKTLENVVINEQCIKFIDSANDFNFEVNRKNKLVFQIYLLSDLDTAMKLLYKHKDSDMLEVMLDYLNEDLSLSLEVIEKFYDYDLSECECFDRYIWIYNEYGVDDKYYQVLINRVMLIGDLKCYQLLENYDDYNKIRDELEKAIMLKGNIYAKIDLCILNEEYDTLFTLCKNRIDLIERHFELFKDKYYVELTLIYKNETLRICEDGAGQDRYDLICKHLLRMARLKESKTTVLEIIMYIRDNYRGRKKLLEDLEFVEATIV